MPRVISVFLPTLSTDRVRRKAGDTAPPPETPLILVGRDGRRRVVLAADAAAQTAGLRIGMPASKAQALVQGLVIQDTNPAADAEALERLAFWMLQRFAPIVAADPPDGIVIDSTGADHLHGGEAATLAIWSRSSPALAYAPALSLPIPGARPTPLPASTCGRQASSQSPGTRRPT
jgi:protein ImuB